jgi:hypothetical protein
MKVSPKFIVVALLVAILGFLTEAHGPFGTFWAPAPDMPTPVGGQIPLFMFLGVAEALALGVSVSFLLFGYSALKMEAVSPSLARAAHLSIVWLLGNWWAHDSLHQHIGMNLNGLLRIEYGFHITLIIAGLTLVRFFLALTRVPDAKPEAALAAR